MERIKQALELARQERALAGEGAANVGASEVSNADSLEANAAVGTATVATPHAAPVAQGAASVRPSPLGIGDRPPPRPQTPVVVLNPDHLERHRILAHNKHDIHSGVFDLLRTQVLQKMSAGGWKTLGIVSPAPGAGKTVVAINLAMSIAQLADRTAMLVDFDLRRPSVLKYLGVQRELTLNNYLRDECTFADVLFKAQLPDLVVAGTAEYLPQSAEMLGSSRIKRLIDEVKNRYRDRITVFDLPPMLNADDALAVLPSLDCVLMVVANGHSATNEVEQALRHLPATNFLGAVLNKAAESADSYGYGQ
jgi:capsular exopolysaccharide synthesis family protein